MATTELSVRIKNATKTASEWASLDPVLLEGEVAFTSDNGYRYKVGDGSSKWSALPYNTMYSHPSYTARTGVPTANQTPGFGGTFTVSQPVSDSSGHITAVNSRTITIPATAAGSSLGLVKSGGDVTISSGIITVNDDSHNHVISNVDGLQAALDGKAASSHTHNYAGSSSAGGSANSAVKLATARAINGVNFDGTAPITVTANPTTTTLSEVNLNDYKTPGFYNGGGGNGCTNLPTGVNAFGMIVLKTAGGYTSQILIGGNGNQNVTFIRTYTGSSWTAWVTQYSTANKPTPADIGAATSGHTHKYAGSSSAGGSATSAVKLDSSAGSATQPVYFSGGKPVATTYTLGKSVPSDAKFTDTTYSVATTSANGLMSSTDKKRLDSIGGGTYHLGDFGSKTVADLQTALDTWLNSYCNIANATATFSANESWVAAWNSGNTSTTISAGGTWTVTNIAKYTAKSYTHLRIAYYSNEWVVYVVRSNGTWSLANQAAFKNDLSAYATSGHTHKYAGSSSAGGAATSAVKLSTARKINGVSFDGTADITFKGSYTSATEYTSVPDGLTYVEMPATANVTGDPTYGAMLTVKYGGGRAFQLVGNSNNKFFMRGIHSGLSSNAGTGYGVWQELVTNDGNTWGIGISGNAATATKATKDASGNTITSTYATKTELNTAKSTLQSSIDGKAAKSHGNHVPTTQTANNAKFLRNDNTWQTVTPANIGAAASSHTHSAYVNQNAFSNVTIGSTTIAADSATDTLTLVAGSNVTLTPDSANDKITIAATDTKYSAGTGISLSGTTFSNSGVRSIATGTSNGTISVNTNGTTANVAVKGLGSAAYTNSSAYATAGHNHDSSYVNVSGDSMSGRLTLNTSVEDHSDPTKQCLVINCGQVPEGTTLTDKNAPGIGFRIGSNSWGSLVFRDSAFRFINNSATGYFSVVASKFVGALQGNADTATKVYHTATNPSSGTTYYIPFVNGASSANRSMLSNDGLRYWTKEGTTSANGEAQLGLGNNIATGTAANKRGSIYMYGTSSGYTQIYPGNNSTSNITITLPSAGGTLARTVDNVASATKLATARTISLTGDVTGSASFDGSANISITATVANDSHTHSYLPLSGGTTTGSILTTKSDATYLQHTVTNSNGSVGIYAATNRGLYDFTKNDWMIYANSSGSVFVNGNSATATTAAKLGRDGNTSVPMTFYWSGKSGQPSWLWGGSDGSNMYVYDPKNFNVNSAAQLTTARNIALGNDFTGSASFNGTSNVTISATFYKASVDSGNVSTLPWHRFAYSGDVTSAYNDKDAIIIINSRYNGGNFGILKISTRTDNITAGANGTATATWLVRRGWAVNAVKIGLYKVTGKLYADFFLKVGAHARCSVYQVTGDRKLTFVNSNEISSNATSGTSTECYSTVEAAATSLHNTAYTSIIDATDGGTANYANTAGGVAWSGVTSKPSYYDAKAIKSITRSGTTFTYTCMDGTTGTFTQQDNNTTYTLSSFGITATAAELNKLDGCTATVTELNYVDGVTSNIQTQLNGKAASSHNHSASNITSGTLGVARGGTGATTFTSGAALIGNGTGAVTTRNITNMTTQGYITYNTNLMTTNTLAYWNGAYATGGSSNLAYCKHGAFGTAATYSATSSITSGSTALVTSGAVYTGLAGKANSSHSHNYVPLAGGTMTGALTANGKIVVPTTGGSWISGMTTSNASIKISTKNSNGSYHPIIAGETYNGHFWNLGTYVDTVGFYGFKSGRTANSSDWSVTVDVTTGVLKSTGGFSGNASSASKVNNNIVIKLNGGSTEGTNLFTYNGSAAKTINITPSAIGAAASSHSHSYLPLSGGSLTGAVSSSSSFSGTEFVGNKWRSSTYGGGWYMSDANWIRTYGSKNIYQNSGIMRTDGSLQVGSSGSYFLADSTGTYINNTVQGNFAITVNESVCRLDSNSGITMTSKYVSSTYPGRICFRSGGYWNSSSDYVGDSGIRLQSNSKTTNGAKTYFMLNFDATGPFVSSKAIYDRTTSSGSEVRVGSDHLLYRYSSATKYKTDIQSIDDQTYAYNVLKLNPKTWYDKSEVESYTRAVQAELNGENPESVYAGYNHISVERINGLIAEDVEAAGLDKYCTYDVNTQENRKELEGISYEKLTTLLIPIVRDLVLYTQKTAKYIHVDEMNDDDRDEIAELLTRINSFKQSEVIS